MQWGHHQCTPWSMTVPKSESGYTPRLYSMRRKQSAKSTTIDYWSVLQRDAVTTTKTTESTAAKHCSAILFIVCIRSWRKSSYPIPAVERTLCYRSKPRRSFVPYWISARYRVTYHMCRAVTSTVTKTPLKLLSVQKQERSLLSKKNGNCLG